MERMTISLDAELATQFDRLMRSRGYRNRSEAIRDLIRERLESERLDQPGGMCVGTLSYVYAHRERELSRRLTDEQHRHHDLAVSTLHVHLDHDHCLETVVLNGATQRVREFAESVIAQPGVRHGKLYLVPVDVDHAEHSHGEAASAGGHAHTHPRT